MSWLARNRTFLAEYDPELLAELVHAELGELEIRQTRRGQPTLRFRSQPVHSQVDPWKEAQRVVGQANAALHLHFGLGLGYFLEADVTAKHTLIFEPHPGVILAAMESRDLSVLLPQRGTRICVGLTRFRDLLAQMWPAEGQLKWVVSPFHEKGYPKLKQRVMQLVQEMRQRVSNANYTIDMMLPTLTGSALASFLFAAAAPSVAALDGLLQNIPAVIVSPGPSLIKQLPWLRLMQQRVCLIAGVRSVKLLEQAGIAPHILIHNEARPYHHLIQDATNLERCVAVLADQAHVAMYRKFQDRTFVYRHPLNPVSQWLFQCYPQTQHEPLLTGGSVATEAFSLALRMGCQPIALVGQDLALQAGQRYATQPTSEPTPVQEMAGVWGQAVQVPKDYASFVYWLRDRALQLRRQNPALRLINLSHGVRLHGFEHVSIRQMTQLCAVKSATVSPLLHSRLQHGNLTQQQVAAMLQQGMANSQQVYEICGQATQTNPSHSLLAQLETDLFELRQQVPFLDGFTQAMLKKLAEPDAKHQELALEYFTAYRKAAQKSLGLLQQASLAKHAAQATQNVNRTNR